MSFRLVKIENLIKEELSLLFVNKLKDPIFGFVTITGVKVVPDFSIAKVYVSVFEKDKREEVLKKLNGLKKMFRTEVAHRINLRHTPELFFYIDDTADYVENIERLVEEIHKNDKKDN